MKSNYSLRARLIFQYMVIVIVCMLVIPTAISELLHSQIKTFAAERLEENESQLMEYLSHGYEEQGKWNEKAMPHGADFMRWPMVKVEVLDADGNVVHTYSKEANNDQDKVAPRFVRPPEVTPDVLVVTRRDIKVRGGSEIVGAVCFTCLPFSHSPEGTFLRRFNKIMYYAVAVMLAAAAVIAVMMASGISRPVIGVAKRAEQISRGTYTMDESMTSSITELQTLIDSVDRLGKSLEEQENLRKRLMSDIAHELRSPVTVIRSHLEAIEDGVFEPTPEHIDPILDEVDRLTTLISEVSKLTKIESAGYSLHPVNFNASEMTESAVKVYEPNFKNKGVELRRNIESDVMMMADGAKIRQVIENFLTNALRYTDAGGRVTVSLRSEGEDVILVVEDTGIGIAEKDLPRIFERFYRTDESRTRVSGGLGLGLAIVKSIVDVHGGTINAESKVGVGSRFTVRLPKEPRGAAKKASA